MLGRKKERFPELRRGIAEGWQRWGVRLADRSPVLAHRPIFSDEIAIDRTVRDQVLARVEAALLAADEPLTPRRLVRLACLPDTGEARRQVARLNEFFDRDDSAFHVQEVAGGYQMLTRPELRMWLDHILCRYEELQLSGPTLETLAIIAYRQPICRADIEAVRGVNVGELLKQLMDKGLVRMVGKEESLGRPYLYGTTRKFLEVFGLRNLHELPLVELLFESPDSRGASELPATSSPDQAVSNEVDDSVQTQDYGQCTESS